MKSNDGLAELFVVDVVVVAAAVVVVAVIVAVVVAVVVVVTRFSRLFGRVFRKISCIVFVFNGSSLFDRDVDDKDDALVD